VEKKNLTKPQGIKFFDLHCISRAVP